MISPSLSLINPFDATKEQKFEYFYTGNQQFKVEIVIKNAISNEIVYNNIQTTFRLEYTLPPYSINNGNTYLAEVYVYDKDNIKSPKSNTIRFLCFSTPIFEIDNLIDRQIIESSQYDLNIKYEQESGELLNNFIIALYDSSGKKIQESGTLNYINTQTYKLQGLTENKYFVDLSGMTVSGMHLYSPKIEFSIQYTGSSIFGIVRTTAIKESASIKIRCNMHAINGNSNNEDIQYIDSSVDLNSGKDIVYFDDGFLLKNNYAMRIILSNIDMLKYNNHFMKIMDENGNNVVTLYKIIGDIYGEVGKKFYIYLSSSDAIGMKYVTTSNYINESDLLNNDEIIINMIKKDNFYTITIMLRKEE